MKTKLTATILLTIICLLLVAGGVTHAQPPGTGYTVYLPIVAKPPCTPTKATAYVATSKPVVRIGEIVTVTGAIVNVCNPFVGHPYFGVYVNPAGVLSPTTPTVQDLLTAVPDGSYTETQFLLLAVGTGPVTVTLGVSYETLNDGNPPQYCWDSINSIPAIVHVLSDP